MLRSHIFLVLFLAGTTLFAQDFSAFDKKIFSQGSGSGILPYRILLPKYFDVEKKYPLILFLHGSGERGNDNEKQLTHGAELFIRDSIRERFPAIVVFPQCAEKSTWTRIQVQGEWGNRTFTFFKLAGSHLFK